MDFSTLQSRISAAYIPPHRTQLHPRMHFSKTLHPSSQNPRFHVKWWTLAAALFIVPFLFYLLALARGVHLSSKFSESKPKGFGLVLHAGPRWTRIRVFEFLNEGPRVPFVGGADGSGAVASMTSRPGLAELGAEGSGRAIMALLDFARERVPKAEWKDTKVWLMVTDRFEAAETGARNAVLESCRHVLRSSGFLFRDEWASWISGEEQGLFSWIAANYAFGTLGADPQETIGIIELADASVQVTFAPKEPPPKEFSRMIKIAGVMYNLYSQSMLQFGQDAAWELLLERHKSRVLTSSSNSSGGTVMDPCIPRGYHQGTGSYISLSESDRQHPAIYSMGNFSECKSVALSLLQKGQDKCSGPPCTMASFMPELQGKPIVADGFFYTSELFGLVPKASLLEIKAAGQHYCESDWAKLKDEYHGIDDIDLLRYCFTSAFIVAFLHDGLGIPMDDKRVGFANQVGSAPLDWTLGAFIKQTAEEPPKGPESVALIIGGDTVAFLSLFAILCLVILVAFVISNLRKPKLKTVYDLEKGHYIVTRVPR